MANVVEVNDESFEREVLAAELPVLVEIGATWCPPCRALEPILEKLAAETVGRVKIVTLDAEESPVTAARYGVRAVPTLLLFRNGDQTVRQLGVTSKEKLRELIGC
jgi:thioredoxin 1